METGSIGKEGVFRRRERSRRETVMEGAEIGKREGGNTPQVPSPKPT